MRSTASAGVPVVVAPIVRRRAPRWRGRLHQVGAVVALPAAYGLAAVSPEALRPAAVVYGLALLALLTSSAAYHRGAWTPRGRRRMKRVDHAAIFVFIAASYTMFSVLLLPRPWQHVLVVAVWIGAAAGTVVKQRRLDEAGGVADVCYLALGWVGVVAFPYLLSVAAVGPVVLLTLGGALYSLGAAVLGARRPDPFPLVFGYHEVGHALMLGGIACHYVLYLALALGA